jgi:tetratricopeptide (TPR) repeat protein
VRAWLVGIAVAGSGVAHAEPDRAAVLFEEGRVLSQQGKYADACDRFEKSYALDSAAGTELNLGDCHEHLGHLAEAWHRFDDAAKRFEVAHDDRAKFARERREAVAAKLGTVVVKLADPSVRVTIAGREEPAGGEITEHVEPGVVDVRAGEITRRTKVVAGATVTVEIPAATTEGPHQPPSPPFEHDERRHSRVVLAYGIGGAGLVTGAIALGVALKARSDYNAEFDNGNCMKTSGPPSCNQLGGKRQQDAISLSNVGTGLGVTAILAIGVGVVVYVTAPRDHVMVVPIASADAGGLVVRGSF